MAVFKLTQTHFPFPLRLVIIKLPIYKNNITKTTQWEKPEPVRVAPGAAGVAVYGQQMSRDSYPETKQHDDDEKVPAVQETAMSDFTSQLQQLAAVVNNHMKFMKDQEKNVDKVIEAAGDSAILLKNAKKKSTETELELLKQISNLDAMSDFLKDIILIENLFNKEYTKQQLNKQQISRSKYASNIKIYAGKNQFVNVSHLLDYYFLQKLIYLHLKNGPNKL